MRQCRQNCFSELYYYYIIYSKYMSRYFKIFKTLAKLTNHSESDEHKNACNARMETGNMSKNMLKKFKEHANQALRDPKQTSTLSAGLRTPTTQFICKAGPVQILFQIPEAAQPSKVIWGQALQLILLESTCLRFMVTIGPFISFNGHCTASLRSDTNM